VKEVHGRVIIGIGHDVVEIGRINVILNSTSGERFMRRVLTEAELAEAHKRANRAEFVAGRFAAKEAVVKALGCGIGAAISFGDIEIMPDLSGKPYCTLSEQAWIRLGMKKDACRLHVSISHERSLASAFAVLEE
jgi:holo-[acyl-carrier protein] synthase